MRKSNFRVSVIVPVYNEEGCVSILAVRLIKVLESYSGYEIIFINDGSSDNTLKVLKQLHSKNNKIHFLSFSRNFGHQNALRAGTKFASGDCIISLDGDLQHPPELIPDLIEKWNEGYDIVYTIRENDEKTSTFKKVTGKLFYKLMNAISDINFEQGEADFRLLDKYAAAELNKLSENAIFFRGMIKWLGFQQIGIKYVPEQRIWGKTKYSRKKMFALAISGITGFSIKPLRISTLIGVSIAFLSLLYGIYALYIKFFTENSIEGWTSVFFMVTFIGGIQLIMIGILGEYIGNIFIESKKRPHYIIKESSLASKSEYIGKA
jgi:polyisoprenyl-phosphate glycosyltransferase